MSEHVITLNDAEVEALVDAVVCNLRHLVTEAQLATAIGVFQRLKGMSIDERPALTAMDSGAPPSSEARLGFDFHAEVARLERRLH